MTFALIFLCIICQFFLIGGQLLLKKAMSPSAETLLKSRRTRFFIGGIGCLTLWFFLWLGVLQQMDLSTAFPFEGLNPALLALGAGLILKERLTAVSWCGIAMITIGIIVVSGS